MEKETKHCQAGCKVFTGGEIRHHKDCDFYKDSFTEMYDSLQTELSEMKKEREELKDYLLEKVNQRMIDNVVLEPRNNMSLVEMAVREELRWIASIVKDL